MKLRMPSRHFLSYNVFLHVGTSNNSSSQIKCTNGFTSIDSLLTAMSNLQRTDCAQQIIPRLNFSCDGAINKWIVKALWNNCGTVFPDLQIWRSSSGNGVYTKVGNTTLYASECNSSSVYMSLQWNLHWYSGDEIYLEYLKVMVEIVVLESTTEQEVKIYGILFSDLISAYTYITEQPFGKLCYYKLWT